MSYTACIDSTLLLIGLTLLGCLSPLLTYAYLWQVKEWRVDRLREHLRAEGFLLQLYGRVRPLILFLFACALFIPGIAAQYVVVGASATFALLTLVQLLLRKQSKPVWTQKAYAIVGLSVILNICLAVVLGFYLPILLPVLVLGQPDIVSLAWLVLWPVDHTLKKQTMQKATALRNTLEDATVIGITGSAGKTTVKELLAHVLDELNPLTTPTHVNSEMGVAKWLLSKLPSYETEKPLLIVEMGAYRRGEIMQLCGIAQPTMGIITLIGSQHIALFGSQEALCDAKGELLEALPEDGQGFVNADSELCAGLAGRAPCDVTRVGTGGSADLEATDIEETSTGIRFIVEGTTVDVPLHGTHNVTNVLLTIAAAEHAGMERGRIVQRLRTFEPPSHTFAVRTEGNVTMLDDTHNASIASFRAAIAWARNQAVGHKVLLTSGLIELGQKQDDVHAELGAAATDVFDRVIFLNERSANSFAKGYGEVEVLSKDTAPVQEESLLVCEGRMTERTIQKLLP